MAPASFVELLGHAVKPSPLVQTLGQAYVPHQLFGVVQHHLYQWSTSLTFFT